MADKEDIAPRARTVEWIAMTLVFATIIYKLIVPGPTSSYQITTWMETVRNSQLLVGFVAICVSLLIIGGSVGYHGLYWHYTNASPDYRMMILAVSAPPIWICFWMQQKFRFIAGEAHFGITSACFILGILIGTGMESVRSRRLCSGPPRFGLTVMYISLAAISTVWATVVADHSEFLKFTFPIQHQAMWSISVLGVLVGWVISIFLERWVKYKTSAVVVLFLLALWHVLVVLPANSFFGLLHEIGLHQFGMPTLVVAVLSGIHSGVTTAPSHSA